MKSTISLCLVAFVVAVVEARPENYSDVDIDVAELFKNDRMMNMYLHCAFDHTKCPPEAKDLNNRIKESLEDGCKRCSPKQIEQIKEGYKYLVENKPEEWNKLVALYDPNHVYSTKYENEMKEALG